MVGIAVYFYVQAVYELVVEPSVAVEVVVFLCDFLQCVCEVECHVLLLGVEQDGEFVGLLDGINHALMLTFIVVVEALL